MRYETTIHISKQDMQDITDNKGFYPGRSLAFRTNILNEYDGWTTSARFRVYSIGSSGRLCMNAALYRPQPDNDDALIAAGSQDIPVGSTGWQYWEIKAGLDVYVFRFEPMPDDTSPKSAELDEPIWLIMNELINENREALEVLAQ